MNLSINWRWRQLWHGFWRRFTEKLLWLSEHPLFGVLSIAFVAFASRFWKLDGTADIVFDEVYYPKFGQNYLTGMPLFDAHPPLGKYIIALGIKLLGYAPLGYRLMSAIAGSLLPLITYELMWQLSDRRSWAWLTGCFVALDGLLLVESRFGLINIYILLFGMLSQLCMVLALKRSRQRWLWTIATGIMFGASFSVKWTGLAYGFGLMAIAIYTRWRYRQALNWPQAIAAFIFLPIAFYILQWLPHLALNPERDLIELHRQIFIFHQNLGLDKTEPIHPYCSPWWSWVLLIRPIAYFFEIRSQGMVEFVHAMGNPILYWCSAIALIIGLGMFVMAGIAYLIQKRVLPQLNFTFISQNITKKLLAQIPAFTNSKDLGYLGYVLISFAAHWLPWSLSRRCIFLYHYMPASVYAFATLSLLVSWLWQSPSSQIRAIGSQIWAAIAIGFLFWLPVYIGLPISSVYMRVLMWLPSWI
ncbi:MAG: phospholipid carrier-dependent glycosyltransferase [Pseudanabaenaceae cyanobacterium bins.39]|nr:phospholipid carrier-dependent glycosyltransferase [Pseudanabaenaceae cyanobacterium bins.39]